MVVNKVYVEDHGGGGGVGVGGGERHEVFSR